MKNRLRLLAILFCCAFTAGRAAADINADFLAAVSSGDTNAAAALLVQGADVNSEDGGGRPALVCAADHGDVPMLQLLLDRYAAVEAPAGVAGLPVLRAERQLDARILCSTELGYLNGHVPVTGIISAVAVLAALLHGRDAVVMSNEASASAGNIVVGDRVVNHQWSKGVAFESALRAALERHGVPVEYFSFLRPASELWVAQHFAAMPQYHRAFRSCNRAFYVDPALRLDHWCGVCDKCCFVDLVLAPFMDCSELAAVFGGHEPLADDALAERFRTLLGTSSSPKPFDCVGDVPECRTALRLTAARPDRAGDALVSRLVAELPDDTTPTTDLLRLSGPHFIPDDYAPGDLLV